MAVLLSLVISLTITPMLCSLFLERAARCAGRCRTAYGGLLGPDRCHACRAAHWLVDRWIFEPLLLRPIDWLHGIAIESRLVWRGLLRHALHHQWWVLPASLLLAASALVIRLRRRYSAAGLAAANRSFQVKPVGRELVPSEDQNRLLVNVICPVGSSIDYVDDMLRKGEKILGRLEGSRDRRGVIATLFSAVSIRPGSLISEGILFVRLIPAEDRTVDADRHHRHECARSARPSPACAAVVLDLSTQGFTATRGYPVDFAVQGPDWKTVTEYAERIRRTHDRQRHSSPTSTPTIAPACPRCTSCPTARRRPSSACRCQRLAFDHQHRLRRRANGRFTDLRHAATTCACGYLEGQRDVAQSARRPVRQDATTASWCRCAMVDHDETSRRCRSSTATTTCARSRSPPTRPPACRRARRSRKLPEIAEEVREEMGLPPSYRIVSSATPRRCSETHRQPVVGPASSAFIVAYMILGVQFNSFVHPFTVLMADAVRASPGRW